MDFQSVDLSTCGHGHFEQFAGDTPDGSFPFPEEEISAALEKRNSLDMARDKLMLDLSFTIVDVISCQGAYTLKDFEDSGINLENLEREAINRLVEELVEESDKNVRTKLPRDPQGRLLFPSSSLELIETVLFHMLSSGQMLPTSEFD